MSDDLSTELVATPERASSAQLVHARRHGTLLPPGAAEGLRELAKLSAPKDAVRWLRGKNPEWVVQLNPSDEVRRGLASGKYKLFETKDGRTLATVRDATSGRKVTDIGISDLPDPRKGAQVAKAGAAGAAVAWQAMAIATQQHYLVEISGKLGQLEAGVDDLRERELADRRAELATIVDDLALVERHVAAGEEMSANDRQSAMAAHARAKKIALESLDNATRLLDADADPATTQPDLALADRAAAVAARCAATVLRLPYESEAKRLTAFVHYAEDTEALTEAVTDGIRRQLYDQGARARAGRSGAARTAREACRAVLAGRARVRDRGDRRRAGLSAHRRTERMTRSTLARVGKRR
ncbi:hypothetical protein OJ997_09290 [Solirubrobacter phytolaccae]|uniref:Uncharacterized protein n=1 Tax=Solirubrobacter phytolaccae TaxID=1404360 RepID=A0A9X3S8M5_9ACTN|nr:hypothetical protein [Solirubrobacter phytolaccae]MDA0180486.1 hypothetical protein [Solirubrobacter phytolaccae]